MNSDPQVLAALARQETLLKQIAKAAENTNALLFSMLSPEQKQEHQKRSVEDLVRRTNSQQTR